MIKAVVFDVDGTIADTEPLHKIVRDKVLSRLGLDVETLSPKALFRAKREFWAEVKRDFNVDIDVEKTILQEFSEIAELISKNGIPCRPNLVKLLDFLKESGIKIAIGSSSDKVYVQKVISAFKIDGYFEYLSCGDDVEKAKPEPDIYLKALNALGVAPEFALAIEDSPTGAKAAINANMRCVGYDIGEGECKQDLSFCNFVVKDMAEIIEIIKKENAR